MLNKVVYNACYGGFGLSEKAKNLLNELKGEEVCYYDLPRHDKDLVAVVEELGSEANVDYSDLKIATIDSDRYRISEYDGLERVVTPETDEYISI